MEKQTFASIIIPSYNHSGFVAEAIQSVLHQTFTDYEIIVIDDGSTDDTREVVTQFGHRVRYLWQENQGLSAARNKGIAAAYGEFIGLLDADDLYEPDFLATMDKLCKEDPTADAIYCVSRCIDIENHPLPQRIGKVYPDEQFFDALKRGGFFPPVCMFARKKCYESVGMFDPTFQGSADWDIWLRMAQRFKVVGTEAVLTRYRVVPWSMSSDPSHMLKDSLAVLYKLFDLSDENNRAYTAEENNTFGRVYLTACAAYLQRHDTESAFACLHKALEYDPELIINYDAMYELGLGDQPRGYRGDLTTLDIEPNAMILLQLFERLFSDNNRNLKIAELESKAYANVYTVIGTIAYGARQFRLARSYLFQAISTNPACGFKPHILSRLAKSFLPTQWVEWAKQIR